MSIVYTADVFCDGDDCSLWIHGTTARTPPTKAQARVGLGDDGWKHISGKDYCRECARKKQENKP